MNTTSIKPTALSPGTIVLRVIFFLTGVATVYFLFTRAFPYLNYSTSEGRYWTDSILIFTHVVFGIAATVLGPFQFISAIRKKNVKVHRLMGKIYLISTLIAALVSWMIIVPKHDANLAYQTGLFFLGFAWISTGSMAYLAIRKGKVDIHREWMVRSYVVTLAFVSFRLIADILRSYNFENVESTMAWMCWALPLFVTEIVLQVPKIYED